MPVNVTCRCGNAYSLKDDYAGRPVKCPQCGAITRAGTASVPGSVDSVFDRDTFLLRQKAVALDEKYYVWDENGAPILYVERPAHLLRNLVALAGGIAAGFITFAVIGIPAEVAGDGTVGELLTLVAVLGAVVAGSAVSMGLSVKRHVSFYRDDTKTEQLLEVQQDKKWQPITATFTILDSAGRPIGALVKNYLFNIFRKRWQYYEPNGVLRFTAKEDSIILSLLRRMLGPLFGVLRTNFVIVRGGGDEIIGEFNRKFTLLDRYVLDLNRDPRRQLDRRVALALGVMLDTGERR